MAIEYAVVPNPLVENAHMARVQTRENLTLDNLINDLVATSGLGRPVVESIVTTLFEHMIAELRRGNSVTWSNFLTFSTSLSAVLESPAAALPDDAQLNVNVRVGRELLNRVRTGAELVRVEADNVSPTLLTVAALTGALNALRERDIVQIEGLHLSFDPTHNDAGVFLVAPDGTAVRVTQYTEHGDKKITFIVPAGLPAATAHDLEVKTRLRNAKPTAPLRTATWPQKLTTAA